MDQLPLVDVVVLAQMRTPHAAGVVAVSEAAFHQLAAPPEQALAVIALHPPPIRVHRLLLAGFTLPVPPPFLLPLGVIFCDKPQNIIPSSVRSPHSSSEALPASGPLLTDDESVSPTEEDLARSVLPPLSTQGTLEADGSERKFPQAGRHIAATSFA